MENQTQSIIGRRGTSLSTILTKQVKALGLDVGDFVMVGTEGNRIIIVRAVPEPQPAPKHEEGGQA